MGKMSEEAQKRAEQNKQQVDKLKQTIDSAQPATTQAMEQPIDTSWEDAYDQTAADQRQSAETPAPSPAPASTQQQKPAKQQPVKQQQGKQQSNVSSPADNKQSVKNNNNKSNNKKPAQETPPATGESIMTPFKTISATLTGKAQMLRIENLLPDGLSVDSFMAIAMDSIHRNPVLQECTVDSLFFSISQAARTGLLCDGVEGALVPYWNRRKGQKAIREAQFQPMYQGLIALARESDEIVDIWGSVVREGDYFECELGMHRDLRHIPKNYEGDITHAYCIVELTSGARNFGKGPISRAQIEAIRARSKAKEEGPWVTDFEWMALKTAVKQTLKFIPKKTQRLKAAIQIDNDAENSGGRIIDGDSTTQHEKRVNQLDQAALEQFNQRRQSQ